MTDQTDGPRAAPGWYPDSSNVVREKYWDGTNWSGESREAGIATQPPPTPLDSTTGGGARRGLLIGAVSVLLAAGVFEFLGSLFVVIGLADYHLSAGNQIGQWIGLAGYIVEVAFYGVALAAFVPRGLRADLLRIAAILAVISFSILVASSTYDVFHNLFSDATDGYDLVSDFLGGLGYASAVVASFFALRGFTVVRDQAGGYRGRWFFLSALFIAIYTGLLAASQFATVLGDSHDGVLSGVVTGDIFLIFGYLAMTGGWIVAAVGFKRDRDKTRDRLLASGAIPFAAGFVVGSIGLIIQINAFSDYLNGSLKTSFWMAVVAGLAYATSAGLVAAAFFSSKRTHRDIQPTTHREEKI